MDNIKTYMKNVTEEMIELTVEVNIFSRKNERVSNKGNRSMQLIPENILKHRK